MQYHRQNTKEQPTESRWPRKTHQTFSISSKINSSQPLCFLYFPTGAYHKEKQSICHKKDLYLLAILAKVFFRALVASICATAEDCKLVEFLPGVMANELLGLTKSLGLFFNVSAIIICVNDENHIPLDSDIFQLSWQVSTVDETEVISQMISGASTLIVCQRPGFENEVTWKHDNFGPDLVWLVPSEALPLETAQELPLSLETTVLTYLKQGSETKIEEIYSIETVMSRVTRKTEFGKWNVTGGLKVEEPTIWERRSNLSDVVLVNTLIQWDPVIIVQKHDFSGFMGDILKTLQSSLKFK